MKRILSISALISIYVYQVIFSGAMAIPAVFDSVSAANSERSADNSYVQVFIKKVQNKLPEDCSLNTIPLPSGKVVLTSQPLQIPFISLGSYLRECTARIPYVPEKALKLKTPFGLFRLWASHTGIMYAPEPSTKEVHEGWKAKKIMGITSQEHGGKKLFLASLVLKAVKSKAQEEKFKIVLESGL